MLRLFIFFSTFIVTLDLRDLEELVVGGKPVKIEDVPYQAALYFRVYYFCSGSIVDEKHVVTAGHCLKYISPHPSGLVVRVGTSKMHTGGQVCEVLRFVIHPKFSIREIDYDVGVVELKDPLQFSSVIKPIQLGNTEPSEGEEVKVSGWGYIREIGPPSRKLRSVNVKIVDRKECAKNYTSKFPVTNRMICAFSENKDACYGDSGGPLVHKDRLVGIVSTGEGCARKNFPGVYTSVTNKEVLNFILKEIKHKRSFHVPFL